MLFVRITVINRAGWLGLWASPRTGVEAGTAGQGTSRVVFCTLLPTAGGCLAVPSHGHFLGMCTSQACALPRHGHFPGMCTLVSPLPTGHHFHWLVQSPSAVTPRTGFSTEDLRGRQA